MLVYCKITPGKWQDTSEESIYAEQETLSNDGLHQVACESNDCVAGCS